MKRQKTRENNNTCNEQGPVFYLVPALAMLTAARAMPKPRSSLEVYKIILSLLQFDAGFTVFSILFFAVSDRATARLRSHLRQDYKREHVLGEELGMLVELRSTKMMARSYVRRRVYFTFAALAVLAAYPPA